MYSYEKYPFYIIFNIIWQVVSLWVLLYLSAFINPRFIPDNLMWANNKLRIDIAGLTGVAAICTGALVIESTVLIPIVYCINKLVLSDTDEKAQRNMIARRTAKIKIMWSKIVGRK